MWKFVVVWILYYISRFAGNFHFDSRMPTDRPHLTSSSLTQYVRYSWLNRFGWLFGSAAEAATTTTKAQKQFTVHRPRFKLTPKSVANRYQNHSNGGSNNKIIIVILEGVHILLWVVVVLQIINKSRHPCWHWDNIVEFKTTKLNTLKEKLSDRQNRYRSQQSATHAGGYAFRKSVFKD